MARGIKLKRYAIENANHFHIRGFRIRIEVTEVCGGMVENVFVFRKAPANPFDGTEAEEFQTVASFPDIAEYPVGAVDAETPFPYFRTNVVELDVRSVEEYDYVWTEIMAEVGNLINALDKADEIVAAETVNLGAECDSEDTVSESVSDSL